MSENTQLAQPRNVRECLALPTYQNRFKEVLRERAPQFMSALITISQQDNLSRCDPKSVIGSAMIAATLDLPIEKSLGLCHIIPYGQVAQFQLGYKAYIQLAHRSGQYARLNAKVVNAEAFTGWDEVGEPIIDWTKLDETLPAVGYVFAFKLINGFTKVCYWPKSKVEAHARRFSQAYKRGKQDSPWFTSFDQMALKTVIMNELRQWGVLSVQMQTALKSDMGVIADVGAEPVYVDNDSISVPADDIPMENVTPKRSTPPPRSKKGVAAVVETVPVQEAQPAPIESTKAKEVVDPVLEDQPEEKVPEKAKEPPPAPAVRAFLKDGEEYSAVCEVVKVEPLIVTKAGEPHPSVNVTVKGGFMGTILHIDGAVGEADELTPLPIWKAGAKVAVMLVGRINKTNGKVLARVESVTEASGGTATMTVE